MDKLRIYKTQNGKSPFKTWLNSIKDPVLKMRVLRRLDRLELGHYGDCKLLSMDLYELRLHFGPRLRIYFTQLADRRPLILLGGSKGSQAKDIELAKKYIKYLRETKYEQASIE